MVPMQPHNEVHIWFNVTQGAFYLLCSSFSEIKKRLPQFEDFIGFILFYCFFYVGVIYKLLNLWNRYVHLIKANTQPLKSCCSSDLMMLFPQVIAVR